MAFFKRAPQPLTKIKAPTAAELAPKFKPQPDAQALLKPDQTPAEYLQVLEDNKQSMDGANLLAHGMPERESVWWACESSQKVSGKLNTADKGALGAAQAWVKNPTPENKAAAAAAAGKTDFKGPGGWAAQAAAWSTEPAAPGAEVPATAAASPEAPGLVGAAVAGSVLLAAGLVDKPPMPEADKPKFEIPTQPVAPDKPLLEQPLLETPAQPEVPPVDQPKLAKAMKPFMELGKEIASGKNTWA